jgi:hypothetical protein
MNHRLSVIAVGSFLSLGLCSVARAQPGTPTQPPPEAPAAAPATAPAASGASAGQVAPPPAPLAARDTEEEPRKAHNVIFLELGGNGLVYSINYERLIDETDFSLRVGASYISIGASSGGSTASASLMTFPVLGNYYLGGKNHKLQLGAGLTFMQITVGAGGGKSGLVEASGFVPAPTAVIGYRYIPARGGFAFSVGFTPFIIPSGDKVVFPWAGISFGGIF